MMGGVPPHQATHEVTVDAGRGVVVKRYRSWSRGEPAREWAALTLLAEFAPGLAPAPLRAALQADPPEIVMSFVRGTQPGARVTPRDAEALGPVLAADAAARRPGQHPQPARHAGPPGQPPAHAAGLMLLGWRPPG